MPANKSNSARAPSGRTSKTRTPKGTLMASAQEPLISPSGSQQDAVSLFVAPDQVISKEVDKGKGAVVGQLDPLPVQSRSIFHKSGERTGAKEKDQAPKGGRIVVNEAVKQVVRVKEGDSDDVRDQIARLNTSINSTISLLNKITDDGITAIETARRIHRSSRLFARVNYGTMESTDATKPSDQTKRNHLDKQPSEATSQITTAARAIVSTTLDLSDPNILESEINPAAGLKRNRTRTVEPEPGDESTREEEAESQGANLMARLTGDKRRRVRWGKKKGEGRHLERRNMAEGTLSIHDDTPDGGLDTRSGVQQAFSFSFQL